MPSVTRVSSGSSSVEVHASHGFAWMTSGFWDLACQADASEEAHRDLGICDACRRDVFDSGNRRHRYPFTSCRYCGPRHSILERVPFTRENTTMAGFTMCEECQREYADPDDRRYRHEGNCCAWCGPALRAVSSTGDALGSTDPMTLASRALRAQLTVAMKGNGDLHLVCDATSSAAVTRLRDRAGVRDVSLTVMVRDLDEASRIASLTDKELSLLTSVERSVVLVSIRTDSPLAGEVAAGNQLAGLLLPYTPLHHLLLSEAGRPLVFTPSGVQPSTLLARNAELVAALKNVADIFLLHDRPIAARDDDSVPRVVDDRVTVEHRSRGIAPGPVRLREPIARPVVGFGAGRARAVCYAANTAAGLEPCQAGDDDREAAVVRALERARDVFAMEPRIIAVDASEQPTIGVPPAHRPMTVIPVEHHHAHYVSCMAENGLRGEVLAVVFDGGAPGIVDRQWGGEILLGDHERYDRIAMLRPFALPGAKAVRRQVWTAALSLLDDAFDGQPPLHAMPLFRNIPRRAIEVVRRLCVKSACMASGAQLYFDAIASIVLNRPEHQLDGSLARELDALADPACTSRYPVVIHDGSTPWGIDLRAMARQAALDAISGVRVSLIAARVRNTIVDLTTEVLLAFGGGAEIPVVLSGDLFERTSLADPIRARLGESAKLYTHAAVPAGDDGLALGQVLVADAQMRRSGLRPERSVAIKIDV